MLKTRKHKNASSGNVEIQNISRHGIRILAIDREFFMPFTEFPWFLEATIEQIYNVEFFHGKHLHWPALGVDIELESLVHPELYPLKYT